MCDGNKKCGPCAAKAKTKVVSLKEVQKKTLVKQTKSILDSMYGLYELYESTKLLDDSLLDELNEGFEHMNKLMVKLVEAQIKNNSK